MGYLSKYLRGKSSLYPQVDSDNGMRPPTIKYFPAAKITAAMLGKAEWRFLPEPVKNSRSLKKELDSLVNDLRFLCGKASTPIKGTAVVLVCSNAVLQWFLNDLRLGMLLEPTPHLELIKAGVVGQLKNVYMVTDAYLHPEKQVAPPGAFAVISINENLLETYVPMKTEDQVRREAMEEYSRKSGISMDTIRVVIDPQDPSYLRSLAD